MNVQHVVQTLLDHLVDSGLERGLQVAAYLDGRLIVDAWAGIADACTGRPVTGETLFSTFSVTKGITATVIHLLTERGQIGYDTPVAAFWPEFAAHGKERITIRHVLTHTAGIPRMPDGVEPESLGDWDAMCRAVATLRPLWEPGTRTGYHALTYGWILGEVARRVDGRPIARIVQDDICRPLGISSLYFGVPESREPDVAVLEQRPTRFRSDVHAKLVKLAHSDQRWRVVFKRALRAIEDVATRQAHVVRPEALIIATSTAVYNRPSVRRASLPASGGIMNARALARHYAALACGEVDGIRLLSPESIRFVSTLQTDDVDAVLGWPMRKGLGYVLGDQFSPMGVTGFGHPGAGGAIGFADPAHRFAFALLKNRMTTRPTSEDIAYLVALAVREALGIQQIA